MSDIQWVKGCPERNKRYIIPSQYYGDVIVMRVSTPDVFANRYNGTEYEEYAPIYHDNDVWHVLDWNFERNEFVLAVENGANDKLHDPQARADILAIIYSEMNEVFQMVLL